MAVRFAYMVLCATCESANSIIHLEILRAIYSPKLLAVKRVLAVTVSYSGLYPLPLTHYPLSRPRTHAPRGMGDAAGRTEAQKGE